MERQWQMRLDLRRLTRNQHLTRKAWELSQATDAPAYLYRSSEGHVYISQIFPKWNPGKAIFQFVPGSYEPFQLIEGNVP